MNVIKNVQTIVFIKNISSLPISETLNYEFCFAMQSSVPFLLKWLLGMSPAYHVDTTNKLS